jgi:hypothetical protein
MYRNIHKDMHITLPKGFESKYFSKKVCKQEKSIYRLKQDSRS